MIGTPVLDRSRFRSALRTAGIGAELPMPKARLRTGHVWSQDCATRRAAASPGSSRTSMSGASWRLWLSRCSQARRPNFRRPNRESQVRAGLTAGESRIRTFRPSPDQCLSELVEPCAETTWRARGEFLRGGTNSSSPVVLAMRPWEEICAVEVEKIEQEEHQRGGVVAVRRQLDHAVGGDAVGAHGLGWHFDLALELARATRWPTGRTRLSQ